MSYRRAVTATTAELIPTGIATSTSSVAMRSTTTRGRDAPAASTASRRPSASSAAQPFTRAITRGDRISSSVLNQMSPTVSLYPVSPAASKYARIEGIAVRLSMSARVIDVSRYASAAMTAVQPAIHQRC